MTKASAVLRRLEVAVPKCTRCPELNEYCAEVGRVRRKAYLDQTYWARPVAAFGDHAAKILIVGLAPAAHGANRTGRIFTGDRSGDFLYAGLYRCGLANQPTSVARDDGLELYGVYITATIRCAPPANKPTAEQRAHCASYISEELQTLRPKVILCLGGIGWAAALKALDSSGYALPRPRPRFAHGVEVKLKDSTLLGCYHVSQQNTFTGRLTEAMLDGVLAKARRIAET